MKPLTEFAQEHSALAVEKTPAASATHWVHQLIKLFPSTATEITPELVAALVKIFTQYEEKVLAGICSPISGMPVRFDFLPGIKQFQECCNAIAFEYAEHQRRLAGAKLKPSFVPISEPKFRDGDYTGPIEDVRPRDVLTWERQQEYREFMMKKHNMKNIRLWGFNETYHDGGGRPFAVKLPEEKPQPNPFEEL